MNFTAYFCMSYKGYIGFKHVDILSFTLCTSLADMSPPLTHIHETDIQQLQKGGARSTTFMPQNQFAYGGNIGYK